MGETSTEALAAPLDTSGQQLDDRHTRPDRQQWVDIAKAVSIILVVLWHVCGQQWLPNKLVTFIRMPLFFCVAGLFAEKAIRGSWKALLSSKTAHFMYLYFVWVTVAFVLTTSIAALRDGNLPPFASYIGSVYHPALTLWFIYALAIMFPLAKLFSTVPKLYLLLGLTTLYLCSAIKPDWAWPTFLDRVARLSIAFAVGAVALKPASLMVARHCKLWPFTLTGFLLLSYLIFANNLMTISPLTLVASALGIAAVFMFSRAVQETALGRVLIFIGQRTLYIYVMHRIFLFYCDHAFEMADIPINGWTQLVKAGLAIPATLLAGVISERYAPWLFEAPWLLKRRALQVRVAA